MNLHDLMLRAQAILRRRKVEEELDDELQSHLELQTRKHLDAGLSFEEAKRHARIDFGAVELTKDNCRDERRINAAENLFQDLRYAFRGFRRVIDRLQAAHAGPIIRILCTAGDAELVVVTILVATRPGKLVSAID